MNRFDVYGIVSFVGSVIFGLFCQVQISLVVNGQLSTGWAPNLTNAGASLGLGICAGCCFLASALSRNSGRPDLET